LPAIKQAPGERQEISFVVIDWHKKMKQRSAEGQADDNSRDQQLIIGCLAAHDRARSHMRVPVAGCAKVSKSPGVKKLLDFGACAGENARKRLSYGPFARYAWVIQSF
jgi:hypothetical protein